MQQYLTHARRFRLELYFVVCSPIVFIFSYNGCAWIPLDSVVDGIAWVVGELAPKGPTSCPYIRWQVAAGKGFSLNSNAIV